MTYPKSGNVYGEPGDGWTIAGAKAAAMASHRPGTESNRARAARGGSMGGDVLSAAMVREAVNKLADNAGLTPMRFDPGSGCDRTLEFDWNGRAYAVPVLASDTSAQVVAKVAVALGGKVSGGTVALPVPARPRAAPATDRLAEIRAAFAPGSPARVGFTCPPLALGESAILRLDNTGPEPVGSVSRDGGQTWENAPRWPTPLDVLPGVKMLSVWRRRDGAIVTEGSDGVDRVIKPGEIRTPEDADRLFGPGFGLGQWMREQAAKHGEALPPMTWGGVPVPFERVDPARASMPAPQPTPAPEQVWLPPPVTSRAIPLDADGTVTVSAIQDYGHWVAFAGGGGIEQCELTMGPGWTCIGVATPHGRVMVGDAFAFGSCSEIHIARVLGGATVEVLCHDGTREPVKADELLDPRTSGYHRTRYAPARAGERLRCRVNSQVFTVTKAGPTAILDAADGSRRTFGGMAHIAGWAADPAQWERLDPGAALPEHGTLAEATALANELRRKLRETSRPRSAMPIQRVGVADAEPDFPRATGTALDAIASTLFDIDRRPAQATAYRGGTERETDESLRARCLERLGLPALDARPRSRCVTITPAMRDAAATKLGAKTTLTLSAPAPDLRALADAVGRALESTDPHHATFSGYIVRVQRDEMLFTPAYSTGSGASLAGDTRALAALRRCLLMAYSNERGEVALTQWGAKGPALVVRREGGPVASPVAADPAPTRYDGANGGADQWRWGVGE